MNQPAASVHNDVAVFGNEVFDFFVALQALDNSDINHSRSYGLACADLPDLLHRQFRNMAKADRRTPTRGRPCLIATFPEQPGLLMYGSFQETLMNLQERIHRRACFECCTLCITERFLLVEGGDLG